MLAYTFKWTNFMFYRKQDGQQKKVKHVIKSQIIYTADKICLGGMPNPKI